MANYSLSPFLRFYDSSGNPLANGKVYTYVAGTNTPQTTYSDTSGSTANTNPVILDAKGEAVICLTAGASYKYVVKTAADATVRTDDNIAVTAYPTAAGNSIIAAADAAAQRVLLGFNSEQPSTAGKDLITAATAVEQRTLLGISNNYGRNLIINGGFNVANRYGVDANGNLGIGVNTSGETFYFYDRWLMNYGAGGTSGSYILTTNKYTYNQFSNVPTGIKSDNILSIIIPTNMSGASFFNISQRIEGVACVASDGTKKVTVSFYYYNNSTSAVPLNVSLTQNFGTGGSPSSSVTTTGTSVSVSSSTSTRNYSFTITLPSTTSKTWGSTQNTAYLEMKIILNTSTPSNSISHVLTDVQCEVGDTATPFEYRTSSQELVLCQRYYVKVGVTPTTTSLWSYTALPTTMRVFPTISVFSGSIGTATYGGGTGNFSSVIRQITNPATTTDAVLALDAEL